LRTWRRPETLSFIYRRRRKMIWPTIRTCLVKRTSKKILKKLKRKRIKSSRKRRRGSSNI